MVQEPWMDFVWSSCFGGINITKGCLDLVFCEALTHLWIHHSTCQPTIKRILYSSLVRLKLEITDISVASYEAVSFLLLANNFFILLVMIRAVGMRKFVVRLCRIDHISFFTFAIFNFRS